MAKRAQDRERLARRAAGGDLESARRLVRLLEGRQEATGFDQELVERAGSMLLAWSGIPARNVEAMKRFLDAIRHSTLSEVAGDVGFSVLGDDDAMEELKTPEGPDGESETWRCWCAHPGFVENEGPYCERCGAPQDEAVEPPEEDRGRWFHP